MVWARSSEKLESTFRHINEHYLSLVESDLLHPLVPGPRDIQNIES